MPTTIDYLNNLNIQRNNLADNLNEKGVEASRQELLDTLVPKVLEISNKSINLQEKTVTPLIEEQEIIPDDNYDALSKVTIEAVTNKIDENIKPENIKKDVEILGVTGTLEGSSGGDNDWKLTYIGDLFQYNNNINIINNVIPKHIDPNITSTKNMFFMSSNLTSVPLFNTSKVTDMASMFSNCSKLTGVPLLDTSSVMDMSSMFTGCKKLENIPLFNTSKVTNMQNTFRFCEAFITVPLLDTSKVINMSYMFGNAKIQELPLLDTSSVTDMSGMFYSSNTLQPELPNLNTSKVTDMSYMFYSSSFKTIPELDASSVTNINYMFSSYILTNFGGLKNLGQAYSTSMSANYGYYTLDLSQCLNLTYDSLMNVINNLYDIGSKGCKPQLLRLGENSSKLTEDEIAIITNKGWNVM